MTNDEILTVSEIAIELRCSKAHVYNTIAGKVAEAPVIAAAAMTSSDTYSIEIDCVTITLTSTIAPSQPWQLTF